MRMIRQEETERALEALRPNLWQKIWRFCTRSLLASTEKPASEYGSKVIFRIPTERTEVTYAAREEWSKRYPITGKLVSEEPKRD